jgi:hypothetical protein
MTKLTDDRGEGARARTDAPGGLWPDWSGERSPMAGVEVVPLVVDLEVAVPRSVPA